MRAEADKGDGDALDDRDAEVVGQQAHDGRVGNPGQLFKLRLTASQGDEEDVAAEIGGEDGEQLRPGEAALLGVGCAGDLDGGGRDDAEVGVGFEKVADLAVGEGEAYAGGEQGEREQGEADAGAEEEAGPAEVGPAALPDGLAAPGAWDGAFVEARAGPVVCRSRLRARARRAWGGVCLLLIEGEQGRLPLVVWVCLRHARARS